VDAVAGTPESYANLLAALGIWHPHGAADSCGLHNLQSAFRPALQHFVGVGGLESRNAIQLLHTMFALYRELKRGWKKIVRAVWKNVYGTEAMPNNLLDSEDAPKDVTQAMQEPLVTRWWTIGSLAQFSTKYLDFFLLMATKACCNMMKTNQKENIIALSLLSLASSDWIVANIYLIAGVAKSWLNPQMRWYQGSDPNIGTLGFPSFHCQVQYFLMLEDLKKIEDSWREMDKFAPFSKKLLTSMTNLYIPVGRTINMSELDKARNLTFELTLKVTRKCDLLKKDKAR
jgi:hypothetical protein